MLAGDRIVACAAFRVSDPYWFIADPDPAQVILFLLPFALIVVILSTNVKSSQIGVKSNIKKTWLYR
jgi:hypothetical protein